MEYLLYLLPMAAFILVLVLMSRTAGRRKPHDSGGPDVHPDHWAEIEALRAEVERRDRETQER